MRVKFWGVRGSLPSAPTPEQYIKDTEQVMRDFFAAGFSLPDQISEYLSSRRVPDVGGFGTATTCVEVTSNQGGQVIIDGGSGIRVLANEMMRGPCSRGKGVVHIFLTHFHWDHLLGLPFFTPLFVAGNIIHFYAVQPELETMVKNMFQRPHFPVGFETLPAQIRFHKIEPRKTIKIEEFTVTPYQLDHPDPCWGFKVMCGDRSYSHCVDTECIRNTREALGPDLPLYQGTHLMYFDAQYTMPELAEKANWGHSASQIGLDIAFRERIPKVLFAHHDPGALTHQIQEIQKETQDYYNWRIQQASTNHQNLPGIDFGFAYEGLEVPV
jgi:phosphoribosyl 1,2-cyclic phosphodiesterase